MLLSFVVVVYAVLQGKFQAHPGREGIITGLLSGEEEVRAEAQQSLLDCFSYIVSVSSLFDSKNYWRTTSGGRENQIRVFWNNHVII